MKVVRILLGVLAALIVLIGVLVLLALTPAVQTWAVRKATGDLPGMTVSVGHVAAGLSSADLRDVHVAKDGMVVTTTAVTAKYSAMDYLLHHRVTVHDLSVDGLVIDTRTPAARPKSAASAKPAESPRPIAPASSDSRTQPFDGVLNNINLPVDLNVARFSVPGRALLPNQQSATFDVRGANLIAGQRGTIEWKADLANETPNAPVRGVHTSGTATVHLTTDRHIDLIEMDGTANAEGAKLPADQIRLSAKARRGATGGDETYVAAMNLQQGQTSEPLLTLNGQFTAATHTVAGNWTLAVKSANVAELLSGLGLPDLTAEGNGDFTAKPDADTASARGDVHATLAHPEKISADLAQIGTMNIQLKFGGSLEHGVANLEQLGLDAIAADGRKLAEVHTLQRVGYGLADKRITFTDAKSDLARIAVSNLPLAWAQPFAKPLTIQSGEASMVLTVAAEPDGSQVRVTSAEPITLRNVTVRNGSQTLADRLTLSVKPQAVYGADRLHAELNELNVSVPAGDAVTGRFTADVTQLSSSPSIAFTTDTQAKFVALLKPYLNVETGPLTVVTKSDGTIAGDTMHFEHSSTRITRDNGDALVSIDLRQPLTLNVQTKAVTTPKPDSEALRIALGQVPLSWAQAYVTGSKLDGQLAGGVISVVVRSLDDLAANTSTPIGLRGASVTMNGQPMLHGVDLTADFSGAKHGEAVTFDVRKIEARTASATLFSLSANGDMTMTAKPTINAKGKLTADLSALMQQPAYGGAPTLSQGMLDGSFDAKVADNVQADVRITAKNLVAKEANRTLGDADLRLTATVQTDGSSVVKMPFTLTNGSHKSDLLVDGKLTRGGNTMTFEGAITGNQLIVDDLQPLAGLAPAKNGGTATARANPAGDPPRLGETPRPAPNQPAAQPSATAAASQPAGAARDTQPFWNGFGGHVSLDIKRIDYGKDYSITGLRGVAVIDPKQLSLQSLEGSLKGNPFKLAATLTFDEQQPKPYALTATADVNSFDVGAFLKASNPNQPPQLETKVSVNAKLNGNGGTIADLGKNAYGTFDAAGSAGVVRGLGGNLGKIAKGASMGLGLLGAAQGSDTTAAIAQVVNELTEFKFDKFSIHAERGVDLNVKVPRIEFLSADTRITGSGGIQNQPGVPIEKQPLQFTFQLGAKGHMAVLLNRVHMLGQQRDEQGYQVMTKQFTVKGSVENHQSDLASILEEIGLKALPDVLPGVLKMFGK